MTPDGRGDSAPPARDAFRVKAIGAEEHQGGLVVMADQHRTRPAEPTTPASAEQVG